MKPRLVIMLKEPVAGRVKTRLGRDIGMTASAWWFRHQSSALIRRLQNPRWETWLAVAPDIALHSRFWPTHLPRMAQGRGDLGDRMLGILRSTKAPVMLIGGDIPAITAPDIAHAFKQLQRHELVFGPATDGGFWLVGARGNLPNTLFQKVRWSSPHALQDTLISAKSASIGYAPTMADIDTEADLKRWNATEPRVLRY